MVLTAMAPMAEDMTLECWFSGLREKIFSIYFQRISSGVTITDKKSNIIRIDCSRCTILKVKVNMAVTIPVSKKTQLNFSQIQSDFSINQVSLMM